MWPPSPGQSIVTWSPLPGQAIDTCLPLQGPASQSGSSVVGSTTGLCSHIPLLLTLAKFAVFISNWWTVLVGSTDGSTPPIYEV